MKIHNEQYYKNKLDELYRWAKSTKNKRIIEKFTSYWMIDPKKKKLDYNTFSATYIARLSEGLKSIIGSFRHELKYEISHEVAKAEKAALAKSGIKVKLEDLKQMSTTTFYNKYKTEIEAYRDALIASGVNKQSADEAVSTQYFGSV